MDTFLSPLLLYGACALGGAGVALALPKQKAAPFVFGAILAAAAFGLVMVLLGVASVRAMSGSGDASGGQGAAATARLVWDALPNYHFYIFSAIALGSALRVITHQRPIYSALWFILTIVSSCGLYLILQAEFMAFALVIVYGGAILITYLFVIMLATEAPTEESVEAMNVYDRVSREPVIATFAGFLVLAVLTTMLAGGAKRLELNPAFVATDAPLQPHQLKRLARRVPMGLARTGAVGNNSSGDIFLAFSTANEEAYESGGAKLRNAAFLRNDAIDPVFNAVVEATEEAVIDSMVCNQTMVGRDGNTSHALPLDQVMALLKKYGRL